jgi:arabinogalactan oligomer / maltooligosaccharide transport system substrate-binding protein
VRNRFKVLVGLFLAFALIAAACGGDDEGADETTTTTTQAETTTTTTQAPETTTTTTTEALPPLVVWADENRSKVVQSVAPAFTEATGVEVVVQIIDRGEIRNQVQVAGPAGEGPDVFEGAHDWTGELAANGIVEPIDLGGREGDFFQTALDGFSYGGQLYGVPTAMEAIAMYYNADLVPEPPTTFEEVASICDELGDQITECFVAPGGGDAGDAYHMFPFVSAKGGYIFAYDQATGYDPTDVGIDSPEAVESLTVVEQLIADGVIADTNGDNAKTLFLEGQAPFFLSGPWQLNDFNAAELNYGVAKIPTIDGGSPAPFVGVQGFFLSAFSENKAIAQAFLLDFIADAETQLAFYENDPRSPANIEAFDQISSDPIVEAFALSAADGLPMPNIPEMGNVWGPLGDNMLALRNGTVDAATAASQAAEAIREAIAGG